MSLTNAQKTEIIKLALDTFRLQKGIRFNVEEFDLLVDKPNATSLCSLYLYTTRGDDEFRIKLYVKEFTRFSSIGNYVLTQMENYSTGKDDEVFVAECRLDSTIFMSFSKYLLSSQFREQVLQATNRLVLDDDTGFVLTDDDKYITL